MKLNKIVTLIFINLFLLFSAEAYCDTATTAADSVITTKIKAKIAGDQTLSVFKVGVTTTNGVVSLSGTVNSDTDAAQAIELAQETQGVTDVNSSALMIKQSDHPLADTAITAKVKALFVREQVLNDKDISASSIHVETTDGVVYLSGQANNQQQIDNAIKIAKTINGVKSVESKLEVSKS